MTGKKKAATPAKPTSAQPAKNKPATSRKPLAALVVPPLPLAEALLEAPPPSAEAFHQYMPVAEQEVPAGDVPTYHHNPLLAYRNIRKGLLALTPHEDVLQQLPPPFNVSRMKALPALALGVMYAAAQADPTSSGTVRNLRLQVSPLRELLLSNAVVLAKSGLVPVEAVRRIQKGTGPIDNAQDCVDLAELFTKYAATLAGKTPITQEQIELARSTGNQLLAILKPKGAPKDTRSERFAEIASRDRIGALLVAWHAQHMRRAAHWIWGDAMDEHVPPLHSHAPPVKKTADAPDETTPVAAPAPAPTDTGTPAVVAAPAATAS